MSTISKCCTVKESVVLGLVIGLRFVVVIKYDTNKALTVQPLCMMITSHMF